MLFRSYNKYKKEYQTEEILDGSVLAHTVERARIAPFDERLSLLGMLIDKAASEVGEDMEISDYLMELLKNLKGIRGALKKSVQLSVPDMLERQIQARKKQMEAARLAGSLSEREQRKGRRILRFLEEEKKQILLREREAGEKGHSLPAEEFSALKAAFDSQTAQLRKRVENTKKRLENLFVFVENAFVEGNEMLILVTELTVRSDCARFIGQFGCEAYHRHSQELMLSERSSGLWEEVASLNLEEMS